ncbi:uncharacterized protein LOC132544162 [Ylistrum balloti]|uniref:uncharacterized protein LOC132544162 n=1 Tax=Ylistrum balloti TaxID=509963 RepID=UPI002905E35D|nr:uncharacterized protein LOC132544162 [Ylistrum balloti]
MTTYNNTYTVRREKTPAGDIFGEPASCLVHMCGEVHILGFRRMTCEPLGPVDTGTVDSEVNVTTSNASDTFGNVTTLDEAGESNSTSPMNNTDLETNTTTNVTSDDVSSGNSTADNVTSDSLIDGNATSSYNATINKSDDNSTFSDSATTLDDNATLSNSNASVDDDNTTVSDSNTTTLDDNTNMSNINATGSESNKMAENITMSSNMTKSDEITPPNNYTSSDDMTNVARDDLFSVNVTTSNETDIVIGGSLNSSYLGNTNIDIKPDSGSATTTDAVITTPDMSDSGSMVDNTGLGQSPFDIPPSGGVDPFDDPFGNPFGDGADGGDPFGEDIFGPDNTQFDLCTEPPCEPPVEIVTTQRPVTQPPPPPPPPPPAAASKAFDSLFKDQEKFELKRLPQFSLPAAKSEVQAKNRQDVFAEKREMKIARLKNMFKLFNAGIPAFGGVNFFNPTKEFSSLAHNTGNVLNSQESSSKQRDNIDQISTNDNMFSSNRVTEPIVNTNTNFGNSNTKTASENFIQKPAVPKNVFTAPSLPNTAAGVPTQIDSKSEVVSNGVAPPPPPPPQLDKSISKDATFAKFFGQGEPSEPQRTIIESTKPAVKTSQPSNVNSRTVNSGNQPFAWPYQVSGSSRVATQTSAAQRVSSSLVNDAAPISGWLDTTPFLSDTAGGRVIDTAIMSPGPISTNTLDKQLGLAASRIGIPFVGLGDIAETVNSKRSFTNIVDKASPGRVAVPKSSNNSPPVAPGVPMNPDSLFQSPPMNVNTNPFSARRPGVPIWDQSDPALVEFGTPGRSSSSSSNQQIVETWKNAQLPTSGSSIPRKTGSASQQNKPPSRDPPFIFSPKPSSNLGRNFFDNTRQLPDVRQTQPSPSKPQAPVFQPSQFVQPPPPKNLPFSNLDMADSGGIPPPPPPPGRIGFDASEIFAKITSGSFGRSGTGESVITTKRSPRFVQNKISTLNRDATWDNTFFNQPSIDKKSSVGYRTLDLLPNSGSFPSETGIAIKPFQNTNIQSNHANPSNTGSLPDVSIMPFVLSTTTPDGLSATMFPETTSALPPSMDSQIDSILRSTTPSEVSTSVDMLNVLMAETTTASVARASEPVTTAAEVVVPSSTLNFELQGSESTTSSIETSDANINSVVENQTPATKLDQETNPVVTSEVFQAGGQAQLQEFSNAAEICRNCNFINGYCRLELPGNCNRFIECSKHDKEVRAFEKECSHGLFWHQGNLTCERPLRVKCEFDPCLNRGVSNHTYIGKCRAYWSCKRSYSSARCCAKGYGYGLQDGTYGCIPMPDCQDDGHCMSKEERANLTLINAKKPKECNLLANPSDLFSYKRGSLTLPCAPGTRFDQEQCTCITSQAAPISRVCEKDMFLDFEGDMGSAFRDKSGRGNTVHENNVWTDNQGIAKFNKGSTITLWKYSNQNIGSSIAITLRFLSYRYTSRMQTLLSNCDQKSGIAAIDITLDTWKSVVDFKIETTQSPGNKITLPYKALQWNNVTLIYDGGSFVAAVDDAYELMFIQGEIPSKHPPLVIGGCSAKTREGLFGLVDDVSIYNGCIPEDLKNRYLFARR